MRFCKTLGNVNYNITTKHKVCILRGDSGTGKSLLMKTLNAYFAVCGEKCLYIDYNNYHALQNMLNAAENHAYVFMDNADLYYKEINFETLLSGKAECFIASHDLGLIDTKQMGFYSVTYRNGEVLVKEEEY